MRKPRLLKMRQQVLNALVEMNDADLYYVVGVCNGLIQAHQAQKDKALGKKPSALVNTQEAKREPNRSAAR